MLLIGGGSGMSPLWSILADHIESGEQRPVRFFYGARTRADLFYLEELAAIAAQLKDFNLFRRCRTRKRMTDGTGRPGSSMKSSCAICARKN